MHTIPDAFYRVSVFKNIIFMMMIVYHFAHKIPKFRSRRPKGYSAHTRLSTLATGVGKPRPAGTDIKSTPIIFVVKLDY